MNISRYVIHLFTYRGNIRMGGQRPLQELYRHPQHELSVVVSTNSIDQLRESDAASLSLEILVPAESAHASKEKIMGRPLETAPGTTVLIPPSRDQADLAGEI